MKSFLGDLTLGVFLKISVVLIFWLENYFGKKNFIQFEMKKV